MAETSKITVPINVGGTLQNVTYDLKDAVARERISELGKALYWIGVTTTALTDGATTNPITVGGESVTAKAGGVAQYDTEEFAFDGTAWQKLGEGNLGALAYKNSASGSFTPAGSVAVTADGDGATAAIVGVSANGTVPSFSYDANTETLTFDAGAMPTLAASVNALTSVGGLTASFTGTADTVTVS